MSRVAVITGASSGIGAAAAVALAAEGWHVAVTGRNPERTRAVAAATGGSAFVTDFDRLDEVRALAASLTDRFDRIDVLVNNAGGMHHERSLSADGHERTLQHNYLAPFLLTRLLAPALADGRIIGTASIGNNLGDLRLDDLQWDKRRFNGGWRAYGTSKIAMILFTRSLAERGFDAYAVHPGLVATGFGADKPLIRLGRRLALDWVAASPERGAAPLVRLALAEDVGAPSGTYFNRFKPYGRMHASASRQGAAEQLWTLTEQLVGL